MATSQFARKILLFSFTFVSLLHLNHAIEIDSTLEELLRATDVHRLVSHWTTCSSRAKSAERSLQVVPSCGEILTSWTRDEAVNNLSTVINESLGGLEAALLIAALSAAAKNGIQVRKLCASCTDIQAPPSNYDNFCGADDYGFDVRHSGLLFLPLTADATSILPGTHKSIVYCVGTRTNSQPSTEWEGANSGIEVFLNVALTVTTGSAVVIPDYMGQGESQGQTSRGYIVRKSYSTSVIPLWLATNELIRTETDCSSSLANSVATVGYSEGGYASVAAADALNIIGADLIRVEAGGAPFRLSTVTTLSAVENADDGTFPSGSREYFGLVGSSYSSTYRDVANYEKGQDVLSVETRDTIVDLVAAGASDADIKAVTPVSDPTSIFDAELVAWVRDAIQLQDVDPCNNNPQPGVSDLICLAFQDNTLTDILHNAPYPVRLCHSPDDKVIDIGNLPDFDQNSNLSFLQVSETHGSAGVSCLQESLTYFLTGNFQDYPVVDTHVEGGGCPAENRPTVAPSESPIIESEAPSNAQSSDSSVPPSNVVSGLPSDDQSDIPSDVPSEIPTVLIVSSESPIQETLETTETPTSLSNIPSSLLSSAGRIATVKFCFLVSFMFQTVYAAFT